MTGPQTEADLLEIIRKQAEQIEHLIAENARLRKRIEELERQGRKYVAPHSRGTRKAAPKSPGRRAGEGPFTYKLRVLGGQSPPKKSAKLCAAIFRHTCARIDLNEFNCGNVR